MNDQEREAFNRIRREEQGSNKSSPAAVLMITAGFTVCILVFGMTWVWSGDNRYLAAGGLLMLATVFAAAGIATYQSARRK